MATPIWKPTLQAADALDSQRFTVAWGELAYDDPFTVILSYDGRFPQPWTRTEVQREIVSLRHIEIDGLLEPVPIALSNEGDVYTLMEGRTDWSKIPGAGLLSDDAEGFGAVHTLLVAGATQYVLGNSRQLYQREGFGDWRRLSADNATRPGYEAEHFGQACLWKDNSLVIAGLRRPAGATGGFTTDPRYRPDMTPDEIVALMNSRRTEAAGGSPITRLYHRKSDQFMEIDADERVRISGMDIDFRNRVWITGLFGLILCGDPEAGFERLGFQGDTEALFSSAWFRDEMIMATDDGLRRFDGHKLHVIKPVLSSPSINRNVPTPLRVQACGDILMYFDRKHGVCRWNGSTWDWVKIPPGLLARTFVGLRSP